MSDITPAHMASKTPMLNNTAYDRLKWTAQILLPALGALYFGLASIWGLPKAEEVVGSITVIDLFLGALLSLSMKQYNQSDSRYDGKLVVDKADPMDEKFSLEFDAPLEDLAKSKEIALKVEEERSTTSAE